MAGRRRADVLDRPCDPVPVGGAREEVNAYVERVTRELSARGPSGAGARPVALARACPRLAQGATRERAAGGVELLLEGTDGGSRA